MPLVRAAGVNYKERVARQGHKNKRRHSSDRSESRAQPCEMSGLDHQGHLAGGQQRVDAGAAPSPKLRDAERAEAPFLQHKIEARAAGQEKRGQAAGPKPGLRRLYAALRSARKRPDRAFPARMYFLSEVC